VLSWYVLGIAAGIIAWVFMKADALISRDKKPTSAYVKGVTLSVALVAGSAYAVQRWKGVLTKGGSLADDVYLGRPDF
jgi:H+/Cl- antiporter ClcA